METKTLILLGIFFIVVFFGIYLYCNTCNKMKKCLKDSDSFEYVEKFNKQILKDHLRKEFIDSGRESLMDVYNNLKTNSDKNLFFKGPNLGLTSEQIGLTPEQIQNIIDTLKADVTNKPGGTGSASKQTYVQMVCSCYNILIPYISKVPWDLFIKIYGDAGGLDSNNPQTRMNSEKAIGLDLLSFGLGAAGLGFLTGPLSNLFGLTPQTPPAPDLAAVIAQAIADQAATSTINGFYTQQSTYFIAVNTFIQNYTQTKVDTKILCPPSGTCYTEGSGSNIHCDESKQNQIAMACMKSLNTQDPSVLYDPTILNRVNPNHFNSKLISDPDTIKRLYLKSLLTDPTKSLCALVTNVTSSGAANGVGIPGMMAILTISLASKYQLGFATGILPQFLICISYTISYYHELSLLDTGDINGGANAPYRNAWLSDAIGDTTQIYNKDGTNTFNTQAFPQTKGLLLSLQTICKQFQQYIDLLFTSYFNQLQVTTPQPRDNGCCPGCCQTCYPTPIAPICNCTTNCSQWTIWRIIDPAGQNGIIPSDSTAPNNSKNWYGAIKSRNPNYNFYSPDTGEVTVDNVWNDGTALYIYMVCFREFLNFPYNHFLDYCKMAGYTIPAGISGDQLFFNKMNDLFPTKNGNAYANPQQFGVPARSATSFDLNNPNPTTPIQYDLSGGYPFGLKAPSYRDAIQKWLTPNAVVLKTSSSLLDDTYAFNNYCSPVIRVHPFEFIDGTIFNIPGDDASQKWGNVICDINPKASAVSCLKGGYYPGDSSGVIPNSRTAFCVDISGSASGSGSGYSVKTYPLSRHDPPPMPTVPPSVILQYTGTPVTYTIPAGINSVTFYSWGAGGGCGQGYVSGVGTSIAPGGNGGFQTGTVNVEDGDVIQVNVGQGGSGNPSSGIVTQAFGGGGAGSVYNGLMYGGGGGGRTSILYNSKEIVSTGGGGGGGAITAAIDSSAYVLNLYNGGFAGNAGFKTPGTPLPGCGQGGNATGGGAGGTAITFQTNFGPQTGIAGNPGVKYIGADANNEGEDSNFHMLNNCGAGGGGGGAYGGGSGSAPGMNGAEPNGLGGSSGGGGSSACDPMVKNVVADNGSATSPGGATNSYYSPGIGTGGNNSPGGNGLCVLVFNQ